MTMIDAHQHFWWMDRRPHAWPPAARPTLDHDFTPHDLARAMAAAGVEGTVLMQSLNDAGETDEYLDLAERTPWILGVVGWVPLHHPDATGRALERLAGRRKLVGVRHLINFEPDPGWLSAPQVQEAVGLIAAAGIVFDAVPNDAERFRAVLETAERHPRLPVVLDHLARPPLGGDMAPWAALITRAAQLPNVAIKLSVGLDLVLAWRFRTEELRPFAEHALAAFGPERVMAASNWPVSLLGGAYGAIWAGLADIAEGFDPAGAGAVMGGTCRRIFRLAGPEAPPAPGRATTT